ncbi:MAG TPA: hypothetical protein VG099_05970 [Gemmataceae bacterium]|jgi:hypothetical protein|nr:hypothetical protein [Gemmataceae bacterium]
MRFWTREMAGWALVMLGLFAFYKCYGLLTADDHRLIEGSALTIVGIVIFRGGIHLLKVAVAAQVCAEAQHRLQDEKRTPAQAGRYYSRSPSSSTSR